VPSGHQINHQPGMPLIKALIISELHSTSENTLNNAKEIYQRCYAELMIPRYVPLGNATNSTGHSIQQVTHSQKRPSSPPRVTNRHASQVSSSFGPVTSTPSSNSQCNNYYGGPPSPSFPHSSSRHGSFKDGSQVNQKAVNASESQDARSVPPTESRPPINGPNYLPQVNSAIHRTGNITTRDHGHHHHLQLHSSDGSSIHVNNLVNVSQQDNEATSSTSSYQMQPVSPAQLAIAGYIRTAHQVSHDCNQTNAKYTGKTNESQPTSSNSIEQLPATINLQVRRKSPSSTTYSTFNMLRPLAPARNTKQIRLVFFGNFLVRINILLLFPLCSHRLG
jgi:hypothetical protein